MGKNITLIGMDPNDSAPQAYPVIDANQMGPTVRFTRGEGPDCRLKGFILTGGQGGVVCRHSDPTLSHCLIVGNEVADLNEGIVSCVDSRAVLLNCTITDNLGTGLSVSAGKPVLANSIVWGNTPTDITVDDSAKPTVRYCAVGMGWLEAGTLNANPSFVRQGVWAGSTSETTSDSWIAGDYHLKSQTGHWDRDQRVWVLDDVTSPCIDAGDPQDPVGLEPIPNGEVINLGAYGGTEQASRSPDNQ